MINESSDSTFEDDDEASQSASDDSNTSDLDREALFRLSLIHI